ncbi:hypothetical protein HD806DRAFT_227090 [Xylariaceae sp. AK1471]|nr:hypothetical protein HD806DRAFT_227090 [Xylariaceae sp. AK1471]
MSIQPLPDNVIAQIKSSTAITTLNGVVCGLISNSLDSGAHKVTVSVDYVRGSCSVEDDGLGIPPVEFSPSGGLGKLHFTSKYPPHEGVHGKYGAFLASLASLSLLSITSHHHNYHSHNSIRFHNSEMLAQHTPAPPDQRLLSFPHGTRVTARDLFGSMPVRVKQRAIDAERGLHFKSWELLKHSIVALLFSWDGPVSISVREPASRWTFSVRSGDILRDGEMNGLNLTARVSKILYQAQLTNENGSEGWVPLRASAGKLSVIGAVSLHPVATKRTQFMSIGVRPVPNEHGSNVLYEEINRIFSNSSYGVDEEIENPVGDEQDRMVKDGHYKRDGFTGQELKGRKGVDRWPMFYIKIHIGEGTSSIASQELDVVLDERHGNLVAIVDVLKAMIYEFLKKYNFRPKRIRNARGETSNRNSRPASPRRSLPSNYDSNPTSSTGHHKRQLVGDLVTTQLSIRCDCGPPSRPASPFDLWTRIKSGSPPYVLSNTKVDKQVVGDVLGTPGYSRPRTPEHNISDSVFIPPLFGPDGSLLRPPFAEIDTIGNGAGQERQSVEMDKGRLDEDIQWTNPVTKETSAIDPRTGFIIRPPPKDTIQEGPKDDMIRCGRLRSHGKATSKEDRSMWLGELLSSWENPVFKTTEPRIPSAFSEENGLGRPMQPFECSTWVQGLSEAGSSTQGRVSKAALRNAEIIAQVDRKFIFAKVPVNSNIHEPTVPLSTASLLIIIDQHAADERCRVESLMKDYFKHMDSKELSDISSSLSEPMSKASPARTELLARPIRFDLSIRDAAQFERAATHFAYWGIQYDIVPLSQTGIAGHKQVKVTKLPPSIAERCRLQPRLLIELLRKEVWKVDEHDHHNTNKPNLSHSSPKDDEGSAPHWITRFHGCPEGILDMINSRACRSSIMFNDPLSQKECADLLKRLGDCAFPFQCAHGRPSMVPLVDLGDNMGYTSNKQKPADSFSKVFRTWNANRNHGR